MIDKFCDKQSNYFRELYNNILSTSYNNKITNSNNFDIYDFIRTTEIRHKKIVNILWDKLISTSYITKSKYSGYYCTSDENFVQLKDLKQNIVNNKVKYTTLEDKEVEYITEDTYMFNASKELTNKFTKLLGKNILMNKSQIKEVNNFINLFNLDSFAITRPKERVYWGIEASNSKDHIIYVWIEALFNYISVAVHNYILINQSIDSNEYLCKNLSYNLIKKIMKECNFYHVIGKDITKFHCYLYPLLLIALDIMPNRLNIIVHNHFLTNKKKMSKSLNNSIDPSSLISKYKLDNIRHYMLVEGPYNKDIEFDVKNIKPSYIKNIAYNFVNLFMRISNRRLFCINDYNTKNGFEFSVLKNEINPIMNNVIEIINKKIINTNKINNETETTAYQLFDFNLLSHYTHLILIDLNKFIHSIEPWNVSNNINNNIETDINKQKLKEILVFIIETMRICSIILYPIVPDLTVNFHKLIGVDLNLSVSNIRYFIDKELHNSSTSVFFNIDYDRIKDIFIDK